MAPTKAKTPTGTDIRSFFGKGSSQSQPKASQQSQYFKSTQGSERSTPIEIDRDEDMPSTKTASSPPKAGQSTTKANGSYVARDSASKTTSGLKRKKAAVISSDEDEEKELTPPRKKIAIPSRPQPVKKATVLISSDEEDETPPLKKNKPSPAKAKSAPHQSVNNSRRGKAKDGDWIEDEDEDDDDAWLVDDDDEPVKKGKGKSTAPRKAGKATTKSAPKVPPNVKGKEKEAKEVADEEKPKPKFNWAAARAAKSAGPANPGSKAVPEPLCPEPLAGLTFVFTGELSSFSRDEAVELAKRHGGRVTGQPSSKTSFVVLGEGAGPSKIAALNKHSIKTLDEDAFLDLIGTRVQGDGGEAAEKMRKEKEKEEQAIREAAKDMEKREKKAVKQAGKSASSGAAKAYNASTQLWTTRYAPQTLKDICGNKGQVEKLLLWLQDWPSSLKCGFRKPGKNAMNTFRAILISGPPGIGKTTSAHLCAKQAGFVPIELNASDARSKKLVENSTNIANTSLDGWMGGGEATNVAGMKITDRTCLIMDEVDGMSAGDRGGVGALNQLIKKTKIPIICIANDRQAQKLKPLMATTFNLTFRKPDAAAVRSRISTIIFKEKMKIPSNVVDQLINGAQSDIRQVLNMLSTWKLSSTTMDFDEGKDLVKMNEKYAIMTPFNVTSKVLGPYLFSHTARETLNDKMEYYFHDHSFIPLFIQENYLKTQPSKLRNLDGPEKAIEEMKLLDRAASSISDSDLVDSMIHGSEQHWSLMPLHAVTSTVRPASFVYGNIQAYGGLNAVAFPQWLGQNSKQGKLSRQLNDVQVKMRLKASGDKHEIRQSYLPALFPHIVTPLIDVGSSAVDDVIDRMDDYYLAREDWDTIVELGVDQNRDEAVLKKIPTATKTAFTRKYNTREHPIAFHKAEDFGKVPKKIAAAEVPDLEEAFEAEDEAPEEVPEEDKKASPDELAIKDKLIVQPKKKKAGTKGKGKSS